APDRDLGEVLEVELLDLVDLGAAEMTDQDPCRRSCFHGDGPWRLPGAEAGVSAYRICKSGGFRILDPEGPFQPAIFGHGHRCGPFALPAGHGFLYRAKVDAIKAAAWALLTRTAQFDRRQVRERRHESF